MKHLSVGTCGRRAVLLLQVLVMVQVVLVRVLGNGEALEVYSVQKQERLNTVISETMVQNAYIFPSSSSKVSEESQHTRVRSLCSDLNPDDHNAKRVGCCQPKKMKVIYNVQLHNGKFEPMYNTLNKSAPSIFLPVLNAMRIQKLVKMNDVSNSLKTQRTESSLKCENYFNGTLHVSTDRTYHKLYHAVGDNYAPMVSQVLLDALLDKAYLYLPRMHLEVVNHGMRERPSPYFFLKNFLFSAGTHSASQLQGWCFRRVLWGPGPYVFYNDQRVALRRAVADFSRAQVKHDYGMQKAIPTEFAVTPPIYPRFASVYRGAAQGNVPNAHTKQVPRRKPPIATKKITRIVKHRRLKGDHTSNVSSSHKISAGNITNLVWNTTISEFPSSKTSTGRTPLRIVLYSRGNDGTRSLKMESHLMTAIGEKFEAYTAICCDFNRVTMQQQISYAYHADVIIGLHGAALIHGIFARRGMVMIEFKMQYAYTSVLFPVVTDSRVGKHAVLDTRDYFFVRGQKLKPGSKMPDGTIDNQLINRTTELISYTLDLADTSTRVHRNNPNRYPRDFVFNSMKLQENNASETDVTEFGHLLGPKITSDIRRRCGQMILSTARFLIFSSQKLKGNRTGSTGSSNDIHCPVCYED